MHRVITLLLAVCVASSLFASPPAVGMASNSKSCLACHADTGPWADGPNVILDVLDKGTMTSLRQPDGSFKISAKRGESATVITVIGYEAAENGPVPHRNGWIYVDTAQIGTPSITKFAPGWEADIRYGCKIVGDKSPAYPSAAVTTAPLTVRPAADAADAELSLQVMMTSGEVVKAKPKEGLQSNYFTRSVHLHVID